MADPNNVKLVFLAAIEKPPAERFAFLDQAVAGDANLRARVEALLQAHERPDTFLNQPSPVANAINELSTVTFEAAGSFIGPYKLLEQIGEGGMGVVYMAEQQSPVRRRVALKIIKAGMDTRQVIARFEAERQALAMMDHPNIARVFDGGVTETARPYFVMELVNGIPIIEYCDQNNVPIEERLELFVDVCHAVQHAHQKGIIHRDIKPSNILVTSLDGRGVPKVIDFGVAKATGQQLTEKTLFTAFAQLVGTPLYMSPEQAAMTSVDVDTRSDIYSLGVVLYELLTGTTPFDQQRIRSAALDEICRIIREEEPPKPSTRITTRGESRTATAAHRRVDAHRLGRLVKGDLDWIVMKALEKDRTRRYDTAGNFAADVQRHLRDEPVEACPPSASYRFRKFARRNKARLAILGLILFFLMLMGGGAEWTVRNQAVRQAILQQNVSAALDDVSNWHQLENWPEAMAAVKRAEGLLAAGVHMPELTNRVRQWRDNLETVARLEEISLVNAEGAQLDFSTAGNAEYEREFRKLGIDIDTQTVEESVALIRALSIQPQLTQALDNWAQYRRNIYGESMPRNWVKPEVWWRRPLVVVRFADADEIRARVRLAVEFSDAASLVALAKSVTARRLPTSTTRYMARELYWLANDQKLAIETLQRAQQDHPNDFLINVQLANYLSHPQTREPQLIEAISYFRTAIALRPRNAWMQLRLGSALVRAGRLEEGIQVLQRAIEFQPDRSESRSLLGSALQAQGNIEAAVVEFRSVIDQNPNDPKSRNALAWLLATSPDLEHRNPALAVELAARAVELAPKEGSIWNTLGVARYRAGDWVGAVNALRKSMELGQGGDASDWFFVAMAIWHLGDRAQAGWWYDIALSWMDKNQSAGEELGRFRAEATALIIGAAPSTGNALPTPAAASIFPKRLVDDYASLEQLLISNLFRAGPLYEQLNGALKRTEDEVLLTKTTLGIDHADSVAASFNLLRLYASARRYADVGRLLSATPANVIERYAASTVQLAQASAIWNGGEKQWRQCATFYDMAMFGPAKAGMSTDPGVVAMYFLEYCPVLAELGDAEQYDAVRAVAVDRFGDSRDFAVGERLLMACLLRPTDETQMARMSKWADSTTYADSANQYSCWSFAAHALYEYRRGDHAEALAWGKKCLRFSPAPACKERGHIVTALAHAGLQQFDDARAELAKCQELIDSKFTGTLGEGTYETGLWKDWLIDRILLREANDIVAGRSRATPTRLPAQSIDKPQNRSAALFARANEYAAAARWDEAVADFTQAVELEPKDRACNYRLAVALLKAGREREYREHCHAFLDRAAEIGTFEVADNAGKSSLLLPVDGADFARACEFADFAVTGTAIDAAWLFPWYQLSKALADYRRGRFGAAIESVGRCISHNDVTPQCEAAARYIKASALVKLERWQEAEDELADGDKLASLPRPNVQVVWLDWVVAEQLRREAEVLLAGRPSRAKSGQSSD